MSRQTFLAVCIIGLALGLVLIHSGISSAARALAVPGPSSAPGAMLGSVAGTGKEPEPVSENVLIATPTPTWRRYHIYGQRSYYLIIRQLAYTITASENDVWELISMPIVLLVLLAIQILRTSILGRFEIETPIWKRLLKWIVMYGVTITVAFCFALGLWPLVFPVGWTVLDTVRHLVFCRREGIHPIYATPRKKLYELKGWEWPE